MEEQQIIDNIAPKKSRHRKKLLYSSIKELMEFYFSDVNISKDRFLAQLLLQSDYIDLSVFLKFNKLRRLTNEISDLCKAISKSEMLELSVDNMKVRRKTPIRIKENEEECTIYVERLPADAEHDWLKSIFLKFGPVDYVSIPRYKNNKKIKGFAFIEFSTPEIAKRALEYFESIGSKLPTTMLPDKLVSILTFETESSEKSQNILNKFTNEIQTENKSESIEPETKPTKKRKETDDCKEIKEKKKMKKYETTFEEKEITNEIKSNGNKLKQEQENEVAKTETENSETNDTTETRKRKKKKQERENEVAETENPETNVTTETRKKKKEQENEVAETEVENPETNETTETRKKKKKKLTEENEFAETETENPETNETTETKKKKKKYAQETDCENIEEIEQQEQEDANDKNVTGEKRKRKRKKTKHNANENDLQQYGLQVLAKTEWKQLRNKYLNLQRQKMQSLKEQLYKNRNANVEANVTESKKSAPRDKFTPGAIVCITFRDQFSNLNKFKSDMRCQPGLRYVDVKTGSNVGYIRFSDNDSAKKFSELENINGDMVILEGNEEKEYWNTISQSCEEKFKKESKKQRGRDKLLRKAEKELGKHIKFDAE